MSESFGCQHGRKVGQPCPHCLGFVAASPKPTPPAQPKSFGLPVDDAILKNRIDDSWKAGLLPDGIQPKESVGREWWISGWNPDGYPLKEDSAIAVFVTTYDPKKSEAFLVVEHSAYLAVCQERDEFKQEVERRVRDNLALQEQYAAENVTLKRSLDCFLNGNPSGGDVQLARAVGRERDRLRDELTDRIAELERERDECYARKIYSHRKCEEELTWTRAENSNLIEERDELKKQVSDSRLYAQDRVRECSRIHNVDENHIERLNQRITELERERDELKRQLREINGGQ